jgi:phage gp37-like protein
MNEGAINSIIAGNDSIATYGKHVSDNQLRAILAKRPQKLYVSLDTDAENIAEELCSRIKAISDTKVYLVELPSVWSEKDKKQKGLDASDLGKERYLEYVNSAKEYTSSSIFSIEKYINIIANGAK